MSIETKSKFPLSPEQKVVVESDEEKILVVAGAGSGKSTTLTERVKYLIEEKGVAPEGVVCITFTNAAADEMKDRLKDVKGIGETFIGTIHSFANRIYRQSGLTYELFTLEVDIRLAKEIINNWTNLGIFQYLTLARYTEWLDQKRKVDLGELDPEDAEPARFLNPSEYAEFKEMRAKQQDLCKERNIITFDELLQHTKEYYATLGASIDYVLLDEAQDIGNLEFDFIQGLNAKNLFMVGDDYQNIYSFKGANVRIFKRMAKDKGTAVYYLTDHYRCGTKIIELADKIIEQVPDRIKKTMNVKSGRTGEVITDSKGNVHKYIMALQKEENLNDWFILCRSNKDVNMLVNILRQYNVPVDTFKRAGMSAQEMEMRMALPSVKVLTVHTSKGLENKNVILYGNFPMKYPSWWEPNYEERRVFYVGVTRASEKLILLN